MNSVIGVDNLILAAAEADGGKGGGEHCAVTGTAEHLVKGEEGERIWGLISYQLTELWGIEMVW